jgi:hypothetical protein
MSRLRRPFLYDRYIFVTVEPGAPGFGTARDGLEMVERA